MRNWVEGEHFPEAARVSVQTEVSDEARGKLDAEQVSFVSTLARALGGCEWNDSGIGESIKQAASEAGIDNRTAYIALYWVMLGRDYGPRVASIMAEMEKESLIGLLGAV